MDNLFVKGADGNEVCVCIHDKKCNTCRKKAAQHVYKTCTRETCPTCGGSGDSKLTGVNCQTCNGIGTTRCDGCQPDTGHDCSYEALAYCAVCGCYEGSLLPFCPGRRVSRDEEDRYYKHYCAGTGPFARCGWSSVDAAVQACRGRVLEMEMGTSEGLCDASPGSHLLLDAVMALRAFTEEFPRCAICMQRRLPAEGGVVQPANEWICNCCLVAKVCP